MGPEALRGPHNDIITTLDNTGVTPSQQRRANNLFYSLLDKIAQEAEDPILRMEQLMLAFPAYAEAVEARRRKRHEVEDIAKDSPFDTILDSRVHSGETQEAWLQDISDRVKERHGYGPPILKTGEQIQSGAEPLCIEDMLKAIAEEDITFEP